MNPLERLEGKVVGVLDGLIEDVKAEPIVAVDPPRCSTCKYWVHVERYMAEFDRPQYHKDVAISECALDGESRMPTDGCARHRAAESEDPDFSVALKDFLKWCETSGTPETLEGWLEALDEWEAL